jgi:hypothetical protein
MAQPIVDGIKEEQGNEINVVQLNLLSSTGREAARTFGISLVPATLLFDRRGDLVLRKIGIPDRELIAESLVACRQA